jgi:hypothetical protein
VVEAGAVLTSQDYGYDRTFQPRQRDRAASQAQVRDIASNLDPERLGYSAEADRGAPIIGPDGIVESGNGRIPAVRRVYDENGPQAKAYRDCPMLLVSACRYRPKAGVRSQAPQIRRRRWRCRRQSAPCPMPIDTGLRAYQQSRRSCLIGEAGGVVARQPRWCVHPSAELRGSGVLHAIRPPGEPHAHRSRWPGRQRLRTEAAPPASASAAKGRRTWGLFAKGQSRRPRHKLLNATRAADPSTPAVFKVGDFFAGSGTAAPVAKLLDEVRRIAAKITKLPNTCRRGDAVDGRDSPAFPPPRRENAGENKHAPH